MTARSGSRSGGIRANSTVGGMTSTSLYGPDGVLYQDSGRKYVYGAGGLAPHTCYGHR
ncbi:MAG: hypothetical protein HYX52_02665 [Chloroflexi bacterium]|nr:hypothetical protein [Chloroflexota bacterium]